MRLFGRGRPPRVYVDAKILNMHDPSLPRVAYVGYVMEGNGRQSVKKVDVAEGGDETLESDDAEVLAILYAIDELRGSLDRFTVVCDHESVVSEANRDAVKNPSRLMERLRGTLRDNRSIELEALKANPAHGGVTEYVNRTSPKAR